MFSSTNESMAFKIGAKSNLPFIEAAMEMRALLPVLRRAAAALAMRFLRVRSEPICKKLFWGAPEPN